MDKKEDKSINEDKVNEAESPDGDFIKAMDDALGFLRESLLKRKTKRFIISIVDFDAGKGPNGDYPAAFIIATGISDKELIEGGASMLAHYKERISQIISARHGAEKNIKWN